jgi:two-component system, OmpR family, response regulator MtrA
MSVPEVRDDRTATFDRLDIGALPLVMCVSPDPAVRERLARQLDGGGVVMMFPDLDVLRAMLGSVDWRERVEHGVAAPVTFGDLVVDAPSRQVSWRGVSLPLTRIECELIGRLAAPPAQVWAYGRLFAAVWGSAYLGDNSILHSAVKRLRGKLREATDGLRIETVRGVGYRLLAS